MKLVVCVDARGGMAFYGRRVSSDRIVCDRILDYCKTNLWIEPYSRTLFSAEHELRIADDFLEQADQSEWCFLEIKDPEPWICHADEIVLFCWNRIYPSDLKFPLLKLQTDWVKSYTEDFAGNSHERVTMEVYKRCKRSI